MFANIQHCIVVSVLHNITILCRLQNYIVVMLHLLGYICVLLYVSGIIRNCVFGAYVDSKGPDQLVHCQNPIRTITKCPKISYTKVAYKMTHANSADPDQTAPEGAV